MFVGGSLKAASGCGSRFRVLCNDYSIRFRIYRDQLFPSRRLDLDTYQDKLAVVNWMHKLRRVPPKRLLKTNLLTAS